MATYTTNYNLKKPDATDPISIGDLNDNADIVDAALNAKQNTLTFDSTPTDSSANPVTSGGVYTALESKEDTLTFDTTPTASSTNPVTSGGVYTALQNLTPVTMGSLSLTTSWTDEGDGIYSQSVSITGATSASKIDLQPDATVLDQMQTDGTTALWAVNDNGTVTVYAMGVAPTVALTLQYIRTEVSA